MLHLTVEALKTDTYFVLEDINKAKSEVLHRYRDATS